MKIIITAGGTSERIDDVRTITNSSTGRLGLAIGNTFAEKYADRIEKIYYLHGLRASYPQSDKVKPVAIEGVADLQKALQELLASEKIDAVIHAMAVSDYVVNEVTTLDKIRGTEDLDNRADLSGNKISSDIDDLVIHMKKSPKVISSIKKWAPDTKLVGFKLLSSVPHQELIDVGYHLLQKNDCDFVMANDLSEIGKDRHRGYLIHKDKSYDTMETNEEIADMIARRIFE
ncbi:MAG: phosphopantothenoylcysteine decarboxylase [Anaerovoracaceae bacterium]|nr:phosphopantothenoylcysteine decarboxylase [Anaerovoracaceae bacterium]